MDLLHSKFLNATLTNLQGFEVTLWETVASVVTSNDVMLHLTPGFIALVWWLEGHPTKINVSL